jgi:hypothetical protein
MTPLVRLSVEVDRDALIDACLAFVTHPRDPRHRAAVMGGLIPIDLLEVLALEGGTRRTDVERVVALLDGVTWLPRWQYTA